MRLDAEDIAEIREAVADEGASVLWETKTRAPRDPDKPWLGDASAATQHPASIAFVNMATAAALVTGWKPNSDISSDTRFGIMASNDFVPAVGDRVLRTGREALIVKAVTEASPADVALFYVLEFQA